MVQVSSRQHTIKDYRPHTLIKTKWGKIPQHNHLSFISSPTGTLYFHCFGDNMNGKTLQTFHQVPATWQFFADVFFLEMFQAKNSWVWYEESILSMLAFYEVAPPISSLYILRKREEMEAFWMAFRIITAVRTAKSSTMFSFSLRRRRGSILRSESVVHCGKNTMKTRERIVLFHCNRYKTHNTSQREPRYHVCAVTNPIWHREL